MIVIHQFVIATFMLAIELQAWSKQKQDVNYYLLSF